MTRVPGKAARAAGGLVPAFGIVTLLLADPWLVAVAIGVGAGVVGLGCWVLFRHTYLEIRETSQEGSRTRHWRAGFERHSPPDCQHQSPAFPIPSARASGRLRHKPFTHGDSLASAVRKI